MVWIFSCPKGHTLEAQLLLQDVANRIFRRWCLVEGGQGHWEHVYEVEIGT